MGTLVFEWKKEKKVSDFIYETSYFEKYLKLNK